MTLADFCVSCLVFLLPKIFKLFVFDRNWWMFFSRNVSCTLNLISIFLLLKLMHHGKLDFVLYHLSLSNCLIIHRPLWSLLYCSWIYNYLCNQCLSPLTLWVRIQFKRCVLDTTLCDKVCLWLVASSWFVQGTLVFSTNKTDNNNWNILESGIKHHNPNP